VYRADLIRVVANTAYAVAGRAELLAVEIVLGVARAESDLTFRSLT
jgi:hypothetical protein